MFRYLVRMALESGVPPDVMAFAMASASVILLTLAIWRCRKL
jgi:hypothetical protein